MKSPPIRVLIADGDPLVCRALTHLLSRSASVDIIATSSDRDEVLELVGRLNPAVALVDAHAVRMDGLDVIRSLSRLYPATRVVVLGIYPTMRDHALIAGACRFLLKDCSAAALVEAIGLAASGECAANEPE